MTESARAERGARVAPGDVFESGSEWTQRFWLVTSVSASGRTLTYVPLRARAEAADESGQVGWIAPAVADDGEVVAEDAEPCRARVRDSGGCPCFTARDSGGTYVAAPWDGRPIEFDLRD